MLIAFIVLAIIQVFCMVIIFGAVFAFLQREKLCYKLSTIILCYSLAFLCALPGALVILSVLSSTRMFAHGIKFRPMEKTSSVYWKKYVIYVTEKRIEDERNSNRKKYFDLWEGSNGWRI